MKKLLLILLMCLTSVEISAQASGGQIRRKKTTPTVTNTHNIANNRKDMYAKTGSHNGYDYVDLGLSVKWATCNVGATSPENDGLYFAWGATKAQTDIGCYTDHIRYNIGTNISGSEYDAARTNMGGGWRMPTKTEAQELIDNCKWILTKYNGVEGFRVTGPNKNNIFIPASGYYVDKTKRFGRLAYLWTSTAKYNKQKSICNVYRLYIGFCDYCRTPVEPFMEERSYFDGLCIRSVVD